MARWMLSLGSVASLARRPPPAPPRRGALVGDPLYRRRVRSGARALVYGPLDVVVGHVALFGPLHRQAQRRVHLGVSPTLARRHRNRSRKLPEECPACRVGRALFPLDRGPL